MSKIFVVDDIAANVTVLSMMLKQQGYSVDSATSGPQALEMLVADRPDVILLDVAMPEMSGFDVCRRLKADPELWLIPVILVTACTNEEDMVEGLNAGADDYITKPVARAVLSARVRSALRIKGIYEELAARNEQLRCEISARIKAVEDLRHAQKLESVGQLAGGIAHEFNNLLQAIEGYTAYAMEGLSPEEGRYQDLQQVLKASNRASALTRQLLAFSRRRVLEKESVDPNRVVTDLANMIRPLIGPTIQLQTLLTEQIGIVCGDPGELQQALLNLCLNARDAMPGGGTLTLRTFGGPCPGHACGNAPQRPCAMIQVIDTGCGMSAEARQRVFEPFYTTKETGKGTGLGLANVYGVIRQHGGFAQVESEPGKGTKFTVCLPTIDSPGGNATGEPATIGAEAESKVSKEERSWPVPA